VPHICPVLADVGFHGPRPLTAHGLKSNGPRDPLIVEKQTIEPWNPTSAKTGQIWGTQHSLPTEITPLATIGFLEVCEKFRLALCYPAVLFTALLFLFLVLTQAH
jgi:hypothetical protein